MPRLSAVFVHMPKRGESIVELLADENVLPHHECWRGREAGTLSHTFERTPAPTEL
jgi:hypothetical protein